jgi:hypothetical protein
MHQPHPRATLAETCRVLSAILARRCGRWRVIRGRDACRWTRRRDTRGNRARARPAASQRGSRPRDGARAASPCAHRTPRYSAGPPRRARARRARLAPHGTRALCGGFPLGAPRRSCFRRASRSGNACSWGAGTLFLGATRALPGLARGGRELARALGFAFRFLQALAGALQLFLGNPHALLRDVGLQPCPLKRFCGDALFAASLLHVWARERKSGSLTQAALCFHPGRLSTEFVHNHVDRERRRGQSLSAGNGLHQAARVFATARAVLSPRRRRTWSP